MPVLGTRDSRHERPYRIDYVRGERVLRDSARSFQDAVDRCERRLSKRHNRGEIARIYDGGTLLLEMST